MYATPADRPSASTTTDIGDSADALQGLGLIPGRASDPALFGAGQAILVVGDALLGGSDARRDGYAARV
jgi:gamma-glutamyltranspeptidase